MRGKQRTLIVRRAGGRPLRKRTPRPRAPAAPPVQTTLDAWQVQDVLDQLARAQAELTARGIDVLNVAHAIGRNAVAAFKQELVNSLVQDNLLHDLEELRTALAATPLSADLRLLPEATLNWLCRHLDLSQHLQPGQELEVPAERLSQYDLQGTPPAPERPLAKLRVVRPGWKHQGHILISPQVIVADSLPSVAPAGNPELLSRDQQKVVRSPLPFAMEQVKAVRVNKPETGSKRRRH